MDKKLRSFLYASFALFAAVIVVPVVVVWFASDEAKVSVVEKSTDHNKNAISLTESSATVAVLRSATETVETVPLEEYVVGVVASEMPADFEVEALKAQALTARTYVVKTKINTPDDAKSDITDTVQHQVYRNNDELQALWGADYDWKIARVTEAVHATAGQILTYEGDPITAAFFSTSNGRTENSEDYWQGELPYLRSVESSWDIGTPKFDTEMSLPVHEVEEKLGVQLPEGSSIGKILERTDGGRIAQVEIAGKKFTGKEVREKLGLRSSDFEFSRSGAEVVFTTKGFGHGVGMSQFGAHGMAEAGHDYREIVLLYYQGVEVTNADSVLPKMTAQK